MFLLIVLCIIGSNVQTLAQKAGEIRLNARRLEIFYNQTWGTVCDDSFDDIDAKVACRQLGYETGCSLGADDVEDGTGKTWLDNLECTGTENRLAECKHAGWGVENCQHSEDVGIECGNEEFLVAYTASCIDLGSENYHKLAIEMFFMSSKGDIRLISRRLEIFHNGTWGTICDDYFDDIDAQVACRQLGYNTGISLGPDVEDGTGKTWLDDMQCSGRENRLADCPNRGWGVEDCGHSEDVGIECLDSLDDGHIRLISGMIKIFYNGTWGTVCDDDFDDKNAQVACRQLGYNNGIFAGSTAKKNKYGLTMWIAGETKKLAYCTHAGWGVGNCFPGENVKIKCNNNSEGIYQTNNFKGFI
ncbi:unnamed protein product [Mytilus edulis]|uniref:SRCR domain-containing protein n=1 Tax=Mytilus edulis TaxID=6550 RepID=A0A8S3U883_MYTED|nr:unnamed protein product [Mytilus edulis]